MKTIRTNGAWAVLLATLAAAVSLAGCSAPAQPAIRIGAKDFAEQSLIGEMYAQLLEQAGYRVERKFGLADTAAHQALVAGDVDLYPEYTGTALLTILKLPSDADARRVYQTVAAAYADRFDAVWLDPAPMDNTQAIAMTKAQATQWGIITLSDYAERALSLAAQGTPISLAGPPEFLEREDGLPGLRRVYGDIPVFYLPSPAGERYERAASGKAQSVVAFGTDGEIIGADLALLIDDKGFFPPYQVAPVVRRPVLDANPSLRQALDPLAPFLNTIALRQLNFQITERRRPAAEVAAEYLRGIGLLRGAAPATPTPPAAAATVRHAGAYRFDQYIQPWQADDQITLVLYPDAAALATWSDYEQDSLRFRVGEGAWRLSSGADSVHVELGREDGVALAAPKQIDLTFDGDFVTRVLLDGADAGSLGYSFTLGAGDAHPAMRELHRRLAAVPWLGFKDPGPGADWYDEATRQAVLAFQDAQGLLENGVVDAATWQALANPKAPGRAPTAPPPPTYEVLPTSQAQETPLPVPTRAAPTATSAPTVTPSPTETPAPMATPAPAACLPSLVTSGTVNIRQGPGVNYGLLGAAPPGAVLTATARTPTGDWYQVTYNGQLGWMAGAFLAVTCADGLPTLDAPAPRGAAPGSVAPGDKVVYLTFDDGPSSYTPRYLALLAQYNARATFFEIGQQIAGMSTTVRQVLAQGNDLGNHTWSHPSLDGISEQQFNDQVMKTDAALRQQGAFAQPVQHCLRPPYGATDSYTRDRAARLGYRVVLWTIDTNDWRRPGADQIANTVLTQVKPGSIVLMHDGGGNRQQTEAALEVILQRLSQDGWRFETQCP